MPRPRNPIPTPRCHKGAAVVDVYDGGSRRTITLGPWGSEQAQQEYERLLTRLRAVPSRSASHSRPHDLTINELVLAYMEWTEKNRPTPDARPNRSGTSPRFALRTLRQQYGLLPVTEFGPKTLKALRETWVVAGLSRKVINGRVGAVRRMFRWGVGEELLPLEIFQRLQAVEGLRAGQTDAPDRAPVKPAAMEDLEKALPHMPAAVRSLVLVQLHSAARAGELVKLRVCDIDRTNPDVWTYSPTTHKGTWKGKGRVIYFGERCQEILAPLILKAGTPDAYLFSPERAEVERNAERGEQRVTPKWESHMKRNERKRVGAGGKRAPGKHYTTGTVRQAIQRACIRAGVATFSPHRLRHLAATRARAELGVDVARALCGHTLAAVTEIYSCEVDKQLALQAVKRFG